MSLKKGFKQNTHTIFMLFAILCLVVISAVFVITAGLGAKNEYLSAVDGDESTETTQVVTSFDDFTPTILSGEGDSAEYFNLASPGSANSITNPYLISTSDDLRTLAYLVNGGTTGSEVSATLRNKYATASYRMENHIDISMWNQWVPIGTDVSPFYGNFNGNGHSIYGLTILDDSVATEDSYAGLFGYVAYNLAGDVEYKPVIQRLGLKDTLIQTNREYSGSIVAFAMGQDVNTVPSERIITPTYGSSAYTTESDSGVQRQYSNINAALAIEDCYNTGFISGGAIVGGLVGELEGGAVVFNCYNAPSSTNDYNQNYDVYSTLENGCVGGIVGYTEYRSAAVVYATINTAQVAKLNVSNDSTDIGYILGKKPVDSSTLYNNAATYLTGDYTFTRDYGSGYALTTLRDMYNGENGLNLTRIDSGWANNVSTVWVSGNQVNNGIPVLANVPQLVKFTFTAEDVDGNVIDESLVDVGPVGSTSSGITPANANFTLYEVGFEMGVRLNIIADEQYVFDNTWLIRNLPNSIIPNPTEQRINVQESSSGDDGAYLLFTGYDREIVAVEDFATYAINVTSLQLNNISSDTKFTVNENEYSFDEINSRDPVYVRYNDVITMDIVGNTGYKVTNVESSYGEVTTNEGTYQLIVKDYIDGYMTSNSDQIPSTIQIGISMALTDYSLNLGEYDTSVTATITALVNNQETTLDENTVVHYGDNIELRVSLSDNERFAFKSWTITYANQNPVTQIYTDFQDNVYIFRFTVDKEGPITILPNFDKQSYLITLNQTTGGRMEYTEGELISGKFYFDDTVVVTAIVSEGYEFEGFTVTLNDEPFTVGSNDEVSYNGTEATLTFNGVSGNYVITPIFTILSYNLTVNVLDTSGEPVSDVVSVTNGTGGTSLLGTNEFDYNTNIILNVVANPGYNVVSIVDESNTNYISGNIVSIKGTKNITITVEQILYTVFVSTVIEGQSAFNISNDCIIGTGSYTYGQNVVVSINVPQMFSFVRWEPSQLDNVVFNDDGTIGFTCSSITDNIYLTAVFAPKNTEVSFTTQGFTANNLLMVDNVIIDSNTTLEKAYMANVVVSVNLTSDNAKRYAFSHWLINGAPVSTNITYSFIVGLGQMSVVAVFEPVNYTISVDVVRWDSDSGQYLEYSQAGGVEGAYANSYRYGEQIVLTETTNDGYRFVGWFIWTTNSQSVQGAYVSNENTLSIFVDRASRIYANFEPISKVSAQVSDNKAGYVTGLGDYIEGTLVTLTAKANDGYIFTKWIHNGQETQNPELTFVVGDNDEIVEAIFEPLFTISFESSNDEYGKVIGSGTGKYHDTLTLQAVTENNCTFVGWLVNDVIVSTDEQLNLNVNGDLEVRALFRKNFDWNIVIILAGCALFAIVLIAGSIAYIKMKEAEPMPVRVLLNSKDDKEVLQKSTRRNNYRDTIEPIPTRKNTKANISPIPVRKITVAPINHKGEPVKNNKTAKIAEPVLKTDDSKSEVEKVKKSEKETTKSEKTQGKTTKNEKSQKPKTATKTKPNKK